MSEEQENISVKLPVDCIYEIIQYIVDDVKTLYSCIIVNQTFCQVAIRILWSNPFKYVKDEHKKSKIFQTYFSCLDDQEKEQISTFIHKPVSDFPKPFINYPNFLKEFVLYDIQTSMKSFIRQQFTTLPTENRINSIVRTLNPFMKKLLFNEQSNFKYINVNFNGIQISLERNHMDLSLINDEVLKQVFLNVTRFSFGFNFAHDMKRVEFMNFIKRNAKTLTDTILEHNKDIQHIRLSLKSLYVSEKRSNKLILLHEKYFEILKILGLFILSLNNLKSFETSCFWKNKNFVKLFRKHSHSLTYLKLHEIFDCSIIINILDSCPNLETVELHSFYFNINTDNSISNKQITSNLNHLKNLYVMICNPFIFKLVERIILMSNNNLKTLFCCKSLTYYSYYAFNYDITSSIKSFCTNLTHLFIKILNEREIQSIIEHLNSLQNLIHLKLSFDNFFNYDKIAELGRSFAPSLQILEINSIVITERLEVLLQNIQCNLKEINIYECIDDDILKIIMKYARQRNSLMKFKYLNNEINMFYSQLSPKLLEEARNLFTVDKVSESFMSSFVKSIF
ncbi:hypothetical protein C1645_828523 [Glomus cerebriforme]|uniref:F-box domain-containing protein n=1 Tax=Glomus cerebriforme TaxID=658196 RepID=A0A397SSJ7_9GLOM|nr:hypothetical protein C1645_828523 [Glomus cerebriforme]